MATKKKEDVLEKSAEAMISEEEKPKRTRSKKAADADISILPELGEEAEETPTKKRPRLRQRTLLRL